ncbi:23S rRNA (guanosine(2251)-2'-O)-methyltransferase RlmB, partial [Actinotignum timonense]|nr:23S rRNA (guanosine(2251)-2'-O)-methyltransferase RlmB [Actinotignum timonense]
MGDGRTRRPKGKKRATVGSGGNNRRRLEGKGPTPKAEERVYHKAYKEKQVRDARKAQAEARERSS